MGFCSCDIEKFLCNEDYGIDKEVQLQGVDLLEVLEVPDANGTVARPTVEKVWGFERHQDSEA